MTPPEYINWNESFSVGHSDMDAQHRRIIDIINELFRAIRQDTEAMPEIVHRLVAYSRTHLADEEQLMASVNYPRLEEHSALHRQYVSQVNVYVANLKRGAPVDEREMLDFLKKWWTEHIRQVDQQYRPYLA
jgi:hemerythrin